MRTHQPKTPEIPPRRQAAVEEADPHRMINRRPVEIRPTVTVKAENREETLITRARKTELSASPILQTTPGQRMR